MTEWLTAQQEPDLDRAAQLLQQGKLVAVPTETVYGLAADASNPAAVRAIFAAKGRPADHPLIVHLAAAAEMTAWAKDIPPAAYQLAAAFWPGPLTLLLPKADHVNSVVTGGLDSIGLRVSAHPVLAQILRKGQLAVAAPSANPYKKLSPTSATQVFETLQGKIDAVMDGGDCSFGLESTIVSLLDGEIQILRAGPISQAEIAAVLQQPVLMPKRHQVKVSGNVDAHYQPNTQLQCLALAQISEIIETTQLKLAVLHYSNLPHLPSVSWQRQLSAEPLHYGHALYRELYQADAQQVDLILLELPPDEDAWLAIHDRLARATTKS